MYHKSFRRNLVHLDIFYQDLYYNVLEHVPSYNLENLLGKKYLSKYLSVQVCSEILPYLLLLSKALLTKRCFLLISGEATHLYFIELKVSWKWEIIACWADGFFYLRETSPCFSLTKGLRARNIRIYYPYRIRILAVHQHFYLSICILTLPTQHTTFISDFTIHIGSTCTNLFYISICIRTLPMQHTMFISDFTFHIGSTPTFLYFDLYLNTAYAAHYVYFIFNDLCS